MNKALVNNSQPDQRQTPEPDWQTKSIDLEEMLELAADAILLLSDNQRIIRFNRAAVRLFGYEPHEILGQPLDLLLPERYGEVHRQHLQVFGAGAVSSRHMAERRTLMARHKDGQEFPVEISISRQRHAGTVTFAAIMRDMTAQKKAELALRQSEELYRSVVTTLNEGVLLFDGDGVIRACNASAQKILGVAEAQLIGQSFAAWPVIRQDGTPFAHEAQPVRVTLRTGQPLADVIMGWVHSDQTITWLLLNSQPLPPATEPRPYAAVVSFADITERFELYRVLEQRVVERTREIERRRQVADDLREMLMILNSNRSLDDILAHIVSRACRELGADAGAIFRLKDDRQGLVVQAAQGLPIDFVHSGAMSLTQAAIAQTVAEGQPVSVSDVAAFLQSVSQPAQAESWPDSLADLQRYQALLFVPLFIHADFYGEIGLCFGRRREFSSEELQVAVMIGNQAALAIENAGLHVQVQAMAALEERQRLARELHDSVSQILYGIALSARTAEGFLETDYARASEALRYCLSLADMGLTEMRALILELRPELLESEGIVAAISQYAAALQVRHGVNFELELGEEPGVAMHIKEALYRMTQEAFHNILHHAQATHVRVRLETRESDIGWEVSDDGRGFDPAASFPGHYGLRSMRERAEHVGGTFEIVSTAGAGTCVRARLPLRGRQ
jgi:PAS domain S-box-containing protein